LLGASRQILGGNYYGALEAMIVVTTLGARSAGMLWSVMALLALDTPYVFASEESVDQQTQTALALDAHPGRGAVQFGEHCARCHGATGHGDANLETPALAGQRFAYLVRQLANFSADERESAVMHRVISQENLRDPQTWVDIAAYLNSIPVLRHAESGDGTRLALGHIIFHEQCASCHRTDARGDDDGFVPSLRNQHYFYLVNQMNRLADGDRHNVDENLVRFLRSFDADEIGAVADYLSRLPGLAMDRKTMRANGVVVD
jgi:cytochrome c553